jgi:hypothetical protein
MEIRRPILNAIEQLSQTVLEPTTWPGALNAAVNLLGGDHGVLVANRQSAATLRFGVFAGLDAGDIERFVSPLAMRLVAPIEDLLVPGVVTSSTDYASDSEFAEFYNEIIIPANGFYSVSVHTIAKTSPFISRFADPEIAAPSRPVRRNASKCCCRT